MMSLQYFQQSNMVEVPNCQFKTWEADETPTPNPPCLKHPCTHTAIDTKYISEYIIDDNMFQKKLKKNLEKLN